MRVADRSTARSYLKYINKAKSDYAATTERVSSGNRFTAMSADVSSGTRVLRARTDKYKVEKQLDNVQDINQELSTTETAMQSIKDVLTSIATKIVTASNSATGEAGRNSIANEIQAMQKEILQFANTQYEGKYLFGGTNAASAPFGVDAGGQLTYNGVPVDQIKKDAGGYYHEDAGHNRLEIPMDGKMYMDIGLGIRVDGANVDPDSAFDISYSGLDILGWGTDADGLSNNIYNILTGVISGIRANDAEQINRYATKLNTLSENFSANLTDIGAKTNFLDTMGKRLTKTVDDYKERIQNLMGANAEEESTNLSMDQYVLKTVLQMGSKLLPVSLMDFLT